MIASVHDIQLGYDDIGSGLPLVLLHGFPMHRGLWAPQVNAFVDRCRCVVPDLRGFGESTPRAPYSMDQYADDVVALLDQLGVETAVIGGLSMGGYVAFALWRRHRARVRALVLADTRAGADAPAAREKRQQMIALARAQGSAAVADAMLPGLVGKSTRERQPELVEELRGMLADAPVEGCVGALQAMLERPDSTPDLARIDVPTLIVVGDEDVLTPVAEAEAMHRAIAGSRLEVIAGAGHVSNRERPAAFNQVLGEFITRLTAA